jgi:hypothetical protein
VILGEGVVDRPVGGAEVTREQLRRLREVSTLADVTLRIAPRRMAYHLGLAGAFKLMNCVPEGDIAYTEATEGERLVFDGGDVRWFVIRFHEIGRTLCPDLSPDA